VKAGTKKEFGEGVVTVCKIGMPDILAKRKLHSSAWMWIPVVCHSLSSLCRPVLVLLQN